MKPTTSRAALIAVSVEKPASEIEDVEGSLEPLEPSLLTNSKARCL